MVGLSLFVCLAYFVIPYLPKEIVIYDSARPAVKFLYSTFFHQRKRICLVPYDCKSNIIAPLKVLSKGVTLDDDHQYHTLCT